MGIKLIDEEYKEAIRWYVLNKSIDKNLSKYKTVQLKEKCENSSFSLLIIDYLEKRNKYIVFLDNVINQLSDKSKKVIQRKIETTKKTKKYSSNMGTQVIKEFKTNWQLEVNKLEKNEE